MATTLSSYLWKWWLYRMGASRMTELNYISPSPTRTLQKPVSRDKVLTRRPNHIQEHYPHRSVTITRHEIGNLHVKCTKIGCAMRVYGGGWSLEVKILSIKSLR